MEKIRSPKIWVVFQIGKCITTNGLDCFDGMNGIFRDGGRQSYGKQSLHRSLPQKVNKDLILSTIYWYS